jgi:hypothetical protein
MLELRGLPQSSNELLSLIMKVEQSKKYVWTPGRVVIEAAVQTQMECLTWKDQKAIFKQLHDLLENLVAQGFLDRRQWRQSIGYGDEIAYDVILDSPLAQSPAPKSETR